MIFLLPNVAASLLGTPVICTCSSPTLTTLGRHKGPYSLCLLSPRPRRKSRATGSAPPTSAQVRPGSQNSTEGLDGLRIFPRTAPPWPRGGATHFCLIIAWVQTASASVCTTRREVCGPPGCAINGRRAAYCLLPRHRFTPSSTFRYPSQGPPPTTHISYKAS